MVDSILDNTKKVLGIDPSYDAFDLDIIMHINSVFATLNQLGVGPADGYEIEDNTSLWGEFTAHNKLINSVKSYMVMKVRLMFDPPTTSFAIDAISKQVAEFEWRLNIVVDTVSSSGPPDGFWWAIRDYEEFPLEAEVGDLGFDPITGNVWRKI